MKIGEIGKEDRRQLVRWTIIIGMILVCWLIGCSPEYGALVLFGCLVTVVSLYLVAGREDTQTDLVKLEVSKDHNIEKVKAYSKVDRREKSLIDEI